ncbi:MAG: immune inhibitor A, partial [Bacteroidetes bacterium]|nr:immune inhibitor A [Bacteroidota bacterium]
MIDDAGTGDVSPIPNRPSEAFFVTVKDAGTYFAFVDAASAAVGGPTATYKLSVTRFAAQSGYTNYASTDIPKTIGPGTGSTTSTITVPGNPIVKDISVRIDLNHALMSDIDAILTTPEGTQIHLFTDIGAAATGGQQQMNLFLNDNNGTPFAFTVLKGLGFMPEMAVSSSAGFSKLDLLKGIKAGGTWTLTLYDDTAGANGGTLNNWSLDILPETTPATIATYNNLYSQNFEANDGGYTHSGTADEWAWGTPNTPGTTTANPVAAFTTANSGVNCWKTDLFGTYNASSNQLLESPNITIPAGVGVAYLSWAMRYQVESATFDHLTVTIEEVGGGGLTQELFVWLGAIPTATPGNPTINVPLTGGWGTFYADVSAFIGKTVRFKVRLDSDSSINYGGVAIDDVRIDTQCPDLTAAPANVTITNSICSAPTCSPSSGSFTAPANACPAGSNLQYSTDGVNWSGTIPTYNQSGPIQNIRTRCSCVNDPLNVSPASTPIPTAPGACPQACTCPAPTGSCVLSPTVDLDADCSTTTLASAFVTNLSEPNLTLEVARETTAGSGTYGAFAPSVTFTGLDLPNIADCATNGAPATYGVRVRLTNSCNSVSLVDCQITLRDLILPQVSNCPSNITVNTTFGANCTGTANWTQPVASDNCAVLCRNYQIEKEINGNFVVVNASGTPTPGFLTTFVDGAPASLGVGIGNVCTDDTYRIRYYIRDVHGNPSFPVANPQCEFIITVVCPTTQYTVTGGGVRCTTDNVGPVIGLSDSDAGVNYQLFLGMTPVGAPVPGTGNAISFGPQLAVGTYTVVATVVSGGCQSNMLGSAVVSTFNCTPTISDPCSCLNNATTLTNGQFGEQIKVNAPSTQTWTVSAVSGLYKTTSPNPPASPSPITVGTVLNNIGGNMFTLDGRHIDAIGYSVSVTNGAGTTLTISNTCAYPNPAFTSDLSGPFCLGSDPVELTGNPGDATLGTPAPFFTVNGTPATQFDPSAGLGQYVIVYTVNGGTPSGADPGCVQSVSQTVQVISTPTNMVCNDNVHITLDESCSLELNADQILEGTYGCYDDYTVEVDRTLPLGNGPWQPGILGPSDVHHTYAVKVTHISGNSCWGTILVEDKLPPVLQCPCTSNTDDACTYTCADKDGILNGS